MPGNLAAKRKTVDFGGLITVIGAISGVQKNGAHRASAAD
jgi:hypothetical protein